MADQKSRAREIALDFVRHEVERGATRTIRGSPYRSYWDDDGQPIRVRSGGLLNEYAPGARPSEHANPVRTYRIRSDQVGVQIGGPDQSVYVFTVRSLADEIRADSKQLGFL